MTLIKFKAVKMIVDAFVLTASDMEQKKHKQPSTVLKIKHDISIAASLKAVFQEFNSYGIGFNVYRVYTHSCHTYGIIL